MGAQTISLQAGKWGCNLFLIFQFYVVEFQGKHPVPDGFQLLWLQVLPEVPPASVPRLNLEVPRPWLDFGWANLLLFFCFKNPMPPWTRISHVSFYPHKDQQKNINPPQKQRFNPQLCIHASVPWVPWLVVVLWGKKPYHFSAPQPLWHP